MSYRAIVLMPDEVILWKISGTTDDQIRQALGSSRQTNRQCFGGMMDYVTLVCDAGDASDASDDADRIPV